MDYIISVDAQTADTLAYALGYTDQISDNVGGVIPNPQTKDDFITQTLANYVADRILVYQGNLAADAARQAVYANPPAVATAQSPSGTVTVTPVKVLPPQ